MPYGWEPTTVQVAVHVPWLTVSATNPGSQTYLNDFTSDTVPNATSAAQHITQAATMIGALFSPLPNALYDLATAVTALYAAASLANAYARGDEDRAAAVALMARATAALARLKDAADNAGADPLDAQPVIYAPDPVPWGDALLQDSYPNPYPAALNQLYNPL